MVVERLEATLALAVGAELGEGPVWDELRQELFFVDILGRRVHAYAPGNGGHRSFEVDRPVGAVALREDGGLVLAAGDVFLLADVDGRRIERFGTFQVDGLQVRFNDGKADPFGRFVAGTMHWGKRDALGSLYALHGDARVETLIEAVTISNGLAWSQDSTTFFYIDSPTGVVHAFDIDPESRRLARGRRVAEVRDGMPDGMVMDDEGMLWIAVFEGSRVERIDPADGRRLAVVEVPTPQVTSIAFGGPARDQLYITTAREDFDASRRAAEPDAGDLFVVDPGVSGPAPHRFALAAGS